MGRARGFPGPVLNRIQEVYMFPLSSPKRQPLMWTAYAVALTVFILFSSLSSSYAQNTLVLAAYPPVGTVGTVYTTELSARSGTPPYTFSASGLPAGLTLNATTGIISGTPVNTGTSSVNATVSDANAEHAYVTTSITIYKSGSVSLEVSPEAAPVLLTGQTKQFSAKVYNSSNQSVTWSCSAGTIT